MKPVNLNEITLIAASTNNIFLTLYALRRSIKNIIFFETICFTNNAFVLDDLNGKVKFVNIDKFQSVADYNKLITEDLIAYIKTPHFLIVQWDGFIINPYCFDSRFLNYDYIGAPWMHQKNIVGNGGFSLRSRKLLEALQKVELNYNIPEDLQICITNRRLFCEFHDLCFSDFHVAQKFSFEDACSDQLTFGFHGIFNFPKIMSFEEFNVVANLIPKGAINNLNLKKLLKASVTHYGLKVLFMLNFFWRHFKA